MSAYNDTENDLDYQKKMHSAGFNGSDILRLIATYGYPYAQACQIAQNQLIMIDINSPC